MKVLVFGPSGAGKTYLSKELRRFGMNSVDADMIEGLSSWFNRDGKKVKYPEDADAQFLDNHSFLWDKEYLKAYINKQHNIYIFGYSGNIFEVVDLFDKAFYLDVPVEVQEKRLQHESRENPMGNTEYQRKNAIAWGHELKEKAKSMGVTFIDATQTGEEILRSLNPPISHGEKLR
jgi:adenylate kinase family enzyme